MERFPIIDFLKGISILGVFIIHLRLFFAGDETGYAAMFIIDSFFRFAVPIFIGILGFMTVLKYTKITNWASFYKQKGWFILIPYLIWGAIYAFTPNVFPEYEAGSNLFDILFGYAEAHLFFVVAYSTFLLIIPFVVVTIKKIKKHLLGVVLGASVGAYLILLSDKGTLFFSLFQQLDSRTFINWWPYYAIGLFIGLYKEPIEKFFKKYSFILFYGFFVSLSLQMFFIVVFVFVTNVHIYESFLLLPISVVSLFACVSLYTFIHNTKIGKGIIYLGKNSYPLYLSHILWYKIIFLVCYQNLNIWFLLLVLVGGIILSVCTIFPHRWFLHVLKPKWVT